MIEREPLWLLGFFTGGRHAVVELVDRTDFHGMTIAWSVCNRPVVLAPDIAPDLVDDRVCPSCARWFDTHRHR